MGIGGLTSLIEANGHLYQDVQLRDSRLVVDGANLCHHLYFNSGLDGVHGGEYSAFADLIERFVEALRRCGVRLYMVLDGGADISDKKLQTLIKRATDRIKQAHEAALSRSGKILPPLTRLLFRQTLVRLEVPVVQCFSEADREVAALASEWQCPVLSKDSDFYIFDLPAGLLPIHHFQWEVAEWKGFVPCKIYTASSFCSIYKIQRHVLPAFAALAGNDYVNLEDMRVSLYLGVHKKARSAYLEALLRWLRGFQGPREALVASLRLMGEMSRQKEAEVLKILSVGMEEYQLPPSALGRFFTDGTVPPLPPEVQGLVPDWIRLPFIEGRLPRQILDVLQLKRMNCAAMVEHSSLPSAYLASRPIRQVMYGLLLGDGWRIRVEENDRKGLLQTSVMVRPVCRGAAEQLSLDSLDKAAPSQCFRVFLETLEVRWGLLHGTPPQLRLPLAVTCYWMKHSSPRPELSVLQALLLGLATPQTHRQRPARRAFTTHRLDHFVTHSLNQWQACLRDSIYLNQLLGLPLVEPQISW
ncbi:protein asteroid homolog 1-like [Myripristis murdjan]|uniref:protein asteroid homolog 1-like n=1 Tax=Myripristis murdjan TaxID=586833 RepID=UPI0011761237|nr:protein asteroid homolog 1-like [Myripristis murdjan]